MENLDDNAVGNQLEGKKVFTETSRTYLLVLEFGTSYSVFTQKLDLI